MNCFILSKMRAIVWERALQIALRNRSKEVGRGQYIFNFGKGGFHAKKSPYLCKDFLLVKRN